MVENASALFLKNLNEVVVVVILCGQEQTQEG